MWARIPGANFHFHRALIDMHTIDLLMGMRLRLGQARLNLNVFEFQEPLLMLGFCFVATGISLYLNVMMHPMMGHVTPCTSLYLTLILQEDPRSYYNHGLKKNPLWVLPVSSNISIWTIDYFGWRILHHLSHSRVVVSPWNPVVVFVTRSLVINFPTVRGNISLKKLNLAEGKDCTYITLLGLVQYKCRCDDISIDIYRMTYHLAWGFGCFKKRNPNAQKLPTAKFIKGKLKKKSKFHSLGRPPNNTLITINHLTIIW